MFCNMADVHDKKTRSYNMSHIKSKNTKPELLIRKYIFNKGFRFRLHLLNLLGKPDIVLPKYKTIIFMHGCFGMDMRILNILLYDKAFDKGLIAINEKFEIILSSDLKKKSKHEYYSKY